MRNLDFNPHTSKRQEMRVAIHMYGAPSFNDCHARASESRQVLDILTSYGVKWRWVDPSTIQGEITQSKDPMILCLNSTGLRMSSLLDKFRIECAYQGHLVMGIGNVYTHKRVWRNRGSLFTRLSQPPCS